MKIFIEKICIRKISVEKVYVEIKGKLLLGIIISLSYIWKYLLQ